MVSLFSTTRNTRPLLPDSLRYIRSDVPDRITRQEMQWLIDNGITTIIDLRTDAESREKPCPLAPDSRFRYQCLPVTGGNRVPATPADVPESYITMADPQMAHIIRTILRAPDNVLYFCNAGKDRTGVVSAILLRHLGYPDGYIVEDYLKSADNLRQLLDEYVSRFPEVDREVITPKASYMEAFLRSFDCRGFL